MATTEERYKHFRENAESFVDHIAVMVSKAEIDGDDDLASKLRNWALMPWQAALRDDDTGDLWPSCESCGEYIKSDSDRISSEDGCQFHRACCGR